LLVHGVAQLSAYVGRGTPSDYTLTTLTIAPDVGPYYSCNTFGDEAEGDYIAIGYGFTCMDELDISVAFLYELNASEPDALARRGLLLVWLPETCCSCVSRARAFRSAS
jgi:hypothetical protein